MQKGTERDALEWTQPGSPAAKPGTPVAGTAGHAPPRPFGGGPFEKGGGKEPRAAGHMFPRGLPILRVFTHPIISACDTSLYK